MSFSPVATFRHGNPLMIDYTPVSAVAAGDIVAIGTKLGICHNPIPANTLGALSIGKGVYRVLKDTSVFAKGDSVYNDATNHVGSSTVTGNTLLGWAETASGTGAAYVDVVFNQ